MRLGVLTRKKASESNKLQLQKTGIKKEAFKLEYLPEIAFEI